MRVQKSNKIVLYSLALGTFIIGTDAFLLGAVVNNVSLDLSVTTRHVGLLVTAFAISYAIFAPILGVLSGKVPANLWLSSAILIFSLGNIVCAFGHSYHFVISGRIIAALGAAGFTPQATAVAGSLGAESERGKSLAIVAGGLTVATALGVPLGAFIGNTLGWRSSFGAISVLGVMVAPIVFHYAGNQNARRASTIRERLSALQSRSVCMVLLATVFAVLSEHIVYTYIEPVVTVHGATAQTVSLLLLIFGVGALVGNYLGGVVTDRFGTLPAFIIPVILMGSMLAVTALWSTSITLSFIALFLWGFAGWMYLVPQQARLIGLSERTGPFTVSLNSSALYLGIGLSGAIGGWIINNFGIQYLGLGSIPFAILAIILGVFGHKKSNTITYETKG